MYYVTGEEIRVGDQVLIEKGKTVGVIRAVLETAMKMDEWGVREPGLMIESKPFGLVFWSISDVDDPVVKKAL